MMCRSDIAVGEAPTATVLIRGAMLLMLPVVMAYAESAAAAQKSQAVTPVRVPWKVSAPLADGVELWSRGRRKEALAKFREATARQVRNPIAWHNLGVALVSFKHYTGAMVAFRHEWFHSSLAPSAWFGMGWCHLALNQLREAENSFVMAVIQAPREWQYWRALAETLRRQGKVVAAKAAESRSVRLKPRPARVRWTPLVIKNAIVRLRFPRLTTH